MARPVFGVDRVEEPWAPAWEDGTPLSADELADLAAQERVGRAYEDAMGGPFCGGIVNLGERARAEGLAGGRTCPVHLGDEPCPTCSAYIAAGL